MAIVLPRRDLRAEHGVFTGNVRLDVGVLNERALELEGESSEASLIPRRSMRIKPPSLRTSDDLRRGEASVLPRLS